jgi:predicted nuclease with TOPRIM domain
MNKPTYATSVEVFKQIMKQANELEDENGTLMVRVKDLENENESCMERVKQLEKKNEKHMEIIKCLERENDMYRDREKKFMYVLLLSWFTMLLVACVALVK